MSVYISEYTRHLPYYYVQARTILDRAFINVYIAYDQVQLNTGYRYCSI